MRILYDHQVFSLQDSGGISRYFYELVRHLLQSQGCQPEIVIGVEQNVFRLADLPGVNAWSVRAPFPIRAGKNRYLLNELISSVILPLHGKFDVYHPTLYRAVTLARWGKMVVTHHDCAYERFPHLFKNTDRIRTFRARQFEKADVIICPSEWSRKDLHEFYQVPESRTRVVHHGVSRPVRGTARFESPTQRPFLLYVGSRAAYKNFLSLLKAFTTSGVSEFFDMVVLGGHAADEVEIDLVRKLKLGEKVHFLGTASETQLAGAYEQAHLLIYPSLYEGFGFPPLEAMLAGCPVLAASAACLPEICGNAAIYFDPSSEDSFVESLKLACFSGELRDSNKERGKRIASRFGWEECAAKTLAIYKD